MKKRMDIFSAFSRSETIRAVRLFWLLYKSNQPNICAFYCFHKRCYFLHKERTCVLEKILIKNVAGGDYEAKEFKRNMEGSS